MSGVFINYRAADSNAYAALLHDYLSSRLGAALVFLDSESIDAGADYVHELTSRVRRSEVLLAVVGPRWLARRPGGTRAIDDPGDWIRRELAEAFAHRVPVIPVLVDGTGPLPEGELPADIAELARCQYRQLRHRDAPADLARLLAELRRLFPALGAADEDADPPPRVAMTGTAYDHGRVYQAAGDMRISE
jgi:TIR domain-containing protein